MVTVYLELNQASKQTVPRSFGPNKQFLTTHLEGFERSLGSRLEMRTSHANGMTYSYSKGSMHGIFTYI